MPPCTTEGIIMNVFHNVVKAGGSWMYLAARLLVGVMFFLHGATKLGLLGGKGLEGFAAGTGLSFAVAALVAMVEFAGGVAIAVGAFTRLAAGAGAILVTVAYLMVHIGQGLNPLTNGGELALMYLAAFLILFINGAGSLSFEKGILKRELF